MYKVGKEQQRVSIAQAISTGADIHIADAPTGNLDKATALDELFDNTAQKNGKCVIIATHSDYFHRISDCVVTPDNKTAQHNAADKKEKGTEHFCPAPSKIDKLSITIMTVYN